MSNRRRAGDSSLELLLDTITNTFGGILFLAILVSLLLRTAAPVARQGEAARRFSAAEQASLELKLDDLKDQCARLTRRGTPAPISTPAPEIARGREEANWLSARLANALAERASLAMNTATLQRERTVALDQAAHLEGRRNAAVEILAAAKAVNQAATAESQRLAQLRLTLERNVRPTTIEQTVGMPTLRDSDKEQVGVYVRFGKMFMMHAYRGGDRAGPNPQFFAVVPGSPPVARPKPGAGIEITVDTISNELGRLLSAFPPSHWGIALVVFHDSFAEFQIVKQAIVEAGYEYRPLSVHEGGSIMDSGGRREAQ